MNTAWETPNGKEIGLRIAANTTLWEVYFKSGGQIPNDLSGLFSNSKEAELAIDKYLGKKKVTNAKANSK